MGIKSGGGSSSQGLGSGKLNGKGIEGSDFIVLGKPKLQAVAVVYGSEKQGKSTFCTDNCPGPIAYINFDGRAQSAVKRAMKGGKVIYWLRVEAPRNVSRLNSLESKKLGQEAINKLLDNLNWAVEQSKKDKIRTIVIDTGTELTEILNIAVTGTPKGRKDDYGDSKNTVNAQWWDIFNQARSGNAHLVVLARAQEEWDGGQPSGRFKPRGSQIMRDACDWEGMVRLKVGRSKGTVTKSLSLKITRAGTNKDEEGATYTEEDWEEFGGPFTYACWRQFYEVSEPEDWR